MNYLNNFIRLEDDDVAESSFNDLRTASAGRNAQRVRWLAAAGIDVSASQFI